MEASRRKLLGLALMSPVAGAALSSRAGAATTEGQASAAARLTGSWIITYSWFTAFSVGGFSSTGARINPTPTCQNLLAIAASQNGVNLDGTPILVTGSEQNFLEGDGVSSAFGLGPSSQPPPTAPCLAEKRTSAAPMGERFGSFARPSSILETGRSLPTRFWT